MTQDWPLQIPRLPLLADLEGISLTQDESEWVSKVPQGLMEIISEVIESQDFENIYSP